MRHGKKFNHLSRKKGHRDAMLANMSISLIRYKRINTTLAKAKALRVYVEPLLTKSKDNSTHSRRTVFSNLQNKEAVAELFDLIAPIIMDRPGGYCRIIKTGFRKGDGAETAMIELVDYNDVYVAKTGTVKKSTRRSRRSSGGSNVGAVAAAPAQVVENDSNIKSEEE
jgi:large subunit ribosomal protein L17